MTRKHIQKITGPFFFFLGCALLVGLIRRFGLHNFYEIFENLGFRLVYILILPLVWYFVHTVGWFLVIEETGHHISLWDLLKIKLVGESVNTLTPVSFVGGDPIRLYMLQKKMPGTLSAASVVLDRTMQTLTVVVFLLLSLIAAWFYLDLPHVWKVIFPIATLGMAVGVFFLIHHQRQGIFDSLARLSSRLGIKRFQTDKIQEKIALLDEQISNFYQRGRKNFLLVLGCHLTSRLLGVLEIYLIAHFLMIPLSYMEALFLTSLSILVNIAFVFVPGSMGVMEGAYGALFHLMGHNAVSGVAIQLVRRMRTLFWILVGLVFMLLSGYSRPVAVVEEGESA